MKTITYTFADGTKSTIEVTDEIYTVHKELKQQEKRNHWKNTRRHFSLTQANGEEDFEIPCPCGDSLSDLIEQEDKQEFDELLASILTPKQVSLFKRHHIEGYTGKEIAGEQGLNKSSISRQLQTVYKKINNFFEKLQLSPSAVLIGRGTNTAYLVLRSLL